MALWSALSSQAAAREIPAPLADHPGNIFLAGETVVVPLPAGEGTRWTAVDYDGHPVATGTAVDGRATLGKLDTGYYEVRRDGDKAMTTVGVLAPLQAPTPLTSPIGLDVAMAWFYQGRQVTDVANLCTLAGMNYVRDRLNWTVMEPGKEHFAGMNIYDETARAQAKAGLAILQVNHITPPWAGPDARRFPTDLRDAYRFYRAMARRWQDQVIAFEPWNEPDITMFGGHLGEETAALLKASALGLRAGNPRVRVGSPVLAMTEGPVLDDLRANAMADYCDTWNFHHYVGLTEYPRIYAAQRALAAGKPLWVSECNMPVQWSGDEAAQEPTHDDLRRQAERLPMVYAASVHEGAAATFYFVLPHYVEGQTQYGVLHRDLTPRPVFLALAAVGRLLADAKPLGTLPHPGISGYAFAAKPDGRSSVVLVAWAETPATIELPVAPTAVYDLLGRRVAQQGNTLALTGAPCFALLPVDAASKLALTRPPTVSPAAPPTPISPIVLHFPCPPEQLVLADSATRIAPRRPATLACYAYNFSEQPARGTLHVTAPAGWTVSLPPTLEIAPGERTALPITLNSHQPAGETPETVTVTGDFGAQGKTVLSLRILNRAIQD